MSIFRNISRILGDKAARSIFDKLSRGRSQPELDPYRIKGKNDIGYTAPSVEQENTGASTVNNSLYEQGLLVPDSERKTTRQGMTNFTLSTGRRFAPLSGVDTRQNSAPRELTSFQEKVLMNPDRSTVDISNQLTNVPPQQSSLVQPFAQPVKQSANQIFGDLFARQNAVGAPMMFKINK
tara:strand:- start:38 stop:577 length:540 start_codon:yes stop_codon:yes gene_type:complete